MSATITRIELYAPETETGNVQVSPDDASYTYWGEYDSIGAAMEAADAAGCGIWLTSTPDRGRYTGKITVVQGAKPVYESI